mmetsp:Transcript_25409/g.80213  ORF Transcript_25409/g.80213 Transcript_25409/m.80213 type:complete len:236 (-) Transcript_25409:992-1699(-)
MPPHTVEAGHNVFERHKHGMPHVQAPSHVGWGHRQDEALLAVVRRGLEIALLFPPGVEALFHFRGHVLLSHLTRTFTTALHLLHRGRRHGCPGSHASATRVRPAGRRRRRRRRRHPPRRPPVNSPPLTPGRCCPRRKTRPTATNVAPNTNLLLRRRRRHHLRLRRRCNSRNGSTSNLPKISSTRAFPHWHHRHSTLMPTRSGPVQTTTTHGSSKNKNGAIFFASTSITSARRRPA